MRMSFYIKHNRCELIADHCKKGPFSMLFFAVFININIFKCIQVALNTLFFYIHHSCKEKKSVKQSNRPISGPIRSNPVRCGD